MNFFNLRRMAALLSITLALTPVMDVAAAVVQISQAAAGPMVQDATSQGDISALIAAAGITGTLAATLQYTFNAGVASYRSISTINITSIFNGYMNATSAANANGATVAAVNAAMQSLMTLMAVLFLHYNNFGKLNFSLPLTSASLSQSAIPAGQTADQYLVNILLNELAAWIPIQQAASSGQTANTNNAMLLAAAKQLGLIPATVAAMQNLINVAGCANQPTIQKEINCAISWYNNWIQTVNQNIGLVAQATKNLDDLVTSATSTTNGYVATYSSQINNATTTADVNTAYSAGIAAINGVYPALIGSSGTIEAQNNIATSLEASLAASMNQLGNVMSTQIQTLQSSLNTAAQAFTAAIKAADASFPAALPASGLTATTAANFASSVPGNAVNELNSAQGSITNPIASVTANTAALTKAINDFSAQITADQNAAIKTISNATTTADIVTALNAGIATLNTDYANLMSASGEYMMALNNAQQTEANLTALSKTHAQITGIATALTAVQAAINGASAQLPALPQGGFTVANTALASSTTPAGEYASSLAGAAIQAMVNAQNSIAKKISGGGGNKLSPAQIGAIIAGILGGLGLGLGAAFTKWLNSQDGQNEINKMAEDVVNQGDTNGDGTGLTSDELQQMDAARQADIALDSTGNTHTNMDKLFEDNPGMEQKVANFQADNLAKSLNISDENMSKFSDLFFENIAEGEGFGAILNSGNVTSQQLNALESQGFSPDDVLSVASNSANFPDGYSGSIGDAVKLINKTLSLTDDTKDELESFSNSNDPDGLEAVLKEWTDSVGTTGKLPQVSQDIDFGGAGGKQYIPGADAFNELAGSETNVTKEALQEYVKQEQLTKSDFKEELDQLEDVRDALEENDSENTAEVEALDSQIAEGEAALSDPNTDFAPEE